MISATFNDGKFEVEFGSILDRAKRPYGILGAAGKAGAAELRRHFTKKDHADANKLAPDRRQHLWEKIGQSVQAPVLDADGNKVTIRIQHPIIAQKVFGGDITAKRVANLAIPVSDKAYGNSPSVFEQRTGLKLIFVKQGDKGFLAAKVADSKTLEVEYLLTPSVHQEPDPTALPDEQHMMSAVLKAAVIALNNQLKEGENH